MFLNEKKKNEKGGEKKSMQTLLKLQSEARIQFIKEKDPTGKVTWTNVTTL
jgi:hypothetical protein